MKRRNILAASIACSALPLAGCSVFRRKPLTQELFADKQYQEEVSSFMMTADRRKLIVLGKRNHYVLDMPRQFETILTSSFRPKVEAGFSDFKATGDKISGLYSLRLPNPVAVEDERAAAAAGFERTRDDAMLLEEVCPGADTMRANFRPVLSRSNSTKPIAFPSRNSLQPGKRWPDFP